MNANACRSPRVAWAAQVITGHLLADEKHIDGTQVKVVVEWESCKAFVGRVLSSIELQVNELAKHTLSTGQDRNKKITDCLLP